MRMEAPEHESQPLIRVIRGGFTAYHDWLRTRFISRFLNCKYVPRSQNGLQPFKQPNEEYE